MRKWTAMIMILCLLAVFAAGAQAVGVTIRTFTPFADVDFAAQGYMDMITAWEAETGNVVEDYSGAMDENWMATMMLMITHLSPSAEKTATKNPSPALSPSPARNMVSPSWRSIRLALWLM